MNNCDVFTHSNFILNHRWLPLKWLLTNFEQVKDLVVILLTLNKLKKQPKVKLTRRLTNVCQAKTPFRETT